MWRLVLIALAAGLASACNGGGSAVSSEHVPARCAAKSRPATPLLVDLRVQPTAEQAACIGRTYLNIMAPAWNGLAQDVHAADPSVHVWQTRSLQYGFSPCGGCPEPGLDIEQVRDHHPEWILHDAAGEEVHPPDHPSWVMFDISNVDYLQAWADAAENDLTDGGWSGAVLVDAGNGPAWVSPPIDPATGKPMTDAAHAIYLAKAMATVRGGLKTHGFSMIAENGPFTVIDAAQIGSSDAVSVGRGFALLQGEAWDALYSYFEEALDRLVGAWVWDDEPRLTRDQRIFGLASYLLVSGPASAYAVTPGHETSLYNLNPGLPTDLPDRHDGAVVRAFDSGAVAVNPGAAPAVIELPGETRSFTLPPGGAVIEVKGKLTASYGSS
ncbi:MAG TPA: putative glycoside hydrolase [Gaiellales bacterium]|nr:putative glycoside hydrolase [Gaiellales bacterium]